MGATANVTGHDTIENLHQVSPTPHTGKITNGSKI